MATTEPSEEEVLQSIVTWAGVSTFEDLKCTASHTVSIFIRNPLFYFLFTYIDSS